jgi:hypothetical protein
MTVRSKRVSGKQAIHYRNYRRVRDRALSRLSQAYPETYKELLELEKVNDQANGTKWVGADDSSISVMDSSAGGSGREPEVGNTGYLGEDEGERK